jgi:hypothetical protein
MCVRACVRERARVCMCVCVPVPVAARSKAKVARLLRSLVRIPQGAWIFVCCELITRPEKSYRLFCVVVCDLENIKNGEAMTCVGSQRHKKN